MITNKTPISIQYAIGIDTYFGNRNVLKSSLRLGGVGGVSIKTLSDKQWTDSVL